MGSLGGKEEVLWFRVFCWTFFLDRLGLEMVLCVVDSGLGLGAAWIFDLVMFLQMLFSAQKLKVIVNALLSLLICDEPSRGRIGS